MATYPSVIGASQAKKQRMNKLYATATSVKPARLQPRKTKGSNNMIKRMIKGLVNWSFKEDNQQNDIVIAEDRDEVRISATGIRFEVYRANGGTVVETRRNDRRTGDSVYELHVISSDQDVGQAIGQIITLEALKA